MRKMPKKFFVIAFSIAGVYLVAATAVVAVALAYNNDTYLPPSFDPQYAAEANHAEPQTITRQPSHVQTETHDGTFLRPPVRTNFLFVGLDNNLLADAIMAGTFYRDTGDIHLMSIPRDMYTHIPQHRLEQMRTDGLRPPEVLKLNAVRAFGGRNYGMHYLQAQLGEMLGVQFHYYIEVELAAFRRIVDAIGGVTMYIPRHFKYEDPYQGLFIDIPQGLQHLDGVMAEGVIRFRGFPTGDLARNNMQMEFMQQLVQQAFTREAIMNAPLTLAATILSDVRTNAAIADIAKFMPYMGRGGNISVFTLPGTAEYINGVSWFVPDAQNLPGVVNQVFYNE